MFTQTQRENAAENGGLFRFESPDAFFLFLFLFPGSKRVQKTIARGGKDRQRSPDSFFFLFYSFLDLKNKKFPAEFEGRVSD